MSIRRTNIDRLTDARKLSVPSVGKGVPSNSQGVNGDITVRRLKDSFKFFIKASGIWHGIPVGRGFDKLESTLKNIEENYVKDFDIPVDITLRKIASEGNFTLDPDGDLLITGADVKIDATKKLYLDGGGDTYLYEHAADHARVIVGGDALMRFTEGGADGNQVHFSDASVGFTQLEPTYGLNTTVDFRASNKQNLTFGSGNIVNLNLYFPSMSGNFILLVKQDGTGSRTITNYKVFESDESAADGEAGVKWAGGSAPTLTTDANHVDILSFYWDNDNEIAYGVATLDFQF